MKNAKKMLVIVIALMTVFVITACGEKPSEAVKKDLEEVKTESFDLDDLLDGNDEDLDATQQAKLKKVLAKMQDFDYKIVSEKVDGDTAKVKVKITTYPFGEAYKEAFTEAVSKVSSGGITTRDQLEDYVYNLVFDKMNALKDKSYSKTITFKCKKEDGEWETDVDDDNTDFHNAVYGGMAEVDLDS